MTNMMKVNTSKSTYFNSYNQGEASGEEEEEKRTNERERISN